MNPTLLPAQSLLVKTQPDRERPFVLEDLRTGRRCEFDSVVHLLDSVGQMLEPARHQDEERTLPLKTAQPVASTAANFDSKGARHENEQ
jgi:hypothetical protein